uniref:Glycosyl transferase family 1 domain-containing protein n=1 Tax=Davidia involucrata TaxID=16924 RepID=A0A5B7BFH7_DAVIN
MEEGNNRGDLQRPSSLRPSGSLKSTLSGRSTPRNSPTFRRLHSSRTPRREGRSSGGSAQWCRGNRLVFWLLLITLWTYAGFSVQSRWAHGDNKEGIFGFGNKPNEGNSDSEQNHQRELIANNNSLPVKDGINENQSNLKNIDVVLAKKGNGVSSRGGVSLKKKKSKRSARSPRRKIRAKQKVTVKAEGSDIEEQEQEQEIPKRNTSYGLIVGPFDSTEDRVLEWSPEKRSGTCDRKGEFSRLVWSRKFVLIFHELSMTGAPLSMMELATELLSCGATVSAVVLSKKGGLMPELARRKIKVLEDRANLSFKTAMKADLVIAGSAVCASWIEQYLAHSVAGSSQIAWWIMENRREYFDRSKLVLNRVKMLIFLSEAQSKQWLAWCEGENIKLNSQPALIPLSVNDELAFVAGIACSLNTPSFSTEKMLEKRQLLRNSVRKEMGLKDNDMLVMSLSSINPGKGQLLLLESARLMVEQESPQYDSGIKALWERGQNKSTSAGIHHSRALLQNMNHLGETSNGGETSNELHFFKEYFISLIGPRKENLWLPDLSTPIDDSDGVLLDSNVNIRKLLSESEGLKEQTLKVLIGSVGSKSNKVPYVKALLRFLSQHSNLSNSVLWTPATTRVASLYSAADVYVINSQGLGETFGRVTIEAMAFGLPVLGTDSGGTREIVEHNVTGLLHPLGRPGTEVLSKNLWFFLKNPSARQEMGMRGRKKVVKMYLKRHMYKKFVAVLFKCMRIK